MNWTLKGRHGVVRRKLNQEGFKDCWGKTPRLEGACWQGGRQGRIAREDWKSQPGSFLEGSKSQTEKLDSTPPVALAVGDYWKCLSKGVIVESLVWGRNR